MKFINFITIFAAILSIEAKSEPTKFHAERRMVDGRSIYIHHVAHQMILLINYLPKCGGALISHFHILTAAHCVTHVQNYNSVPAYELLIRAGVTQADDDGVHMLIQLVRVHNYFRLRPLQHDIAMIKLRQAAPVSNVIRPVAMSQVWPKEGEQIVMTGYGSQGGSRVTYPEYTLKIAFLQIFHRSDCKYTSDDKICAFPKFGVEGPCFGDSGAPITINGYLAGIISDVGGCGAMGAIPAYTNLRYYLDWVNYCMQRTLAGAYSC